MSEICPRCKREKVTREQRRADVAPPNGLCWASEHDARSNPHFVEQCERVAELAAAEERGRRAGIEEAAKCPDCGGALESFCSSDKCRDAAIRAWGLAPRDSGKAAAMNATDGPRCWCGRPSVRESGWCGTCVLGDEVIP